MKFLPLVWKNIWRRKFRTTFTLLSIFIDMRVIHEGACSRRCEARLE